MALEKYGISNFKCFEKLTEMAFRPITINIGPNNSGKSSVIKSLNLLKNSLNDIRVTSKTDKSKHILEELHSFSVPNFGEPSAFLNSTDKEFSFSLSIPKSTLPKIFRNYEISIALFYRFSERTRVFSYPDKKVKKTDPFNFGIIGSIKEQKGRGVLVKYLISIDNNPFMEMHRSDELHDAGGYEGGSFEEAYFGEINFFDSSKLSALKKRDSLKYFDWASLKNIKVEFIEDEFINSVKLIHFLAKTLNKNKISFAKEAVSLIESCLSQVIYFQEYLNNVQFINLDRKENKRYIDSNSNSLFKTCIDFYYYNNSSSIGGIHGTLSRILPLFGLPAQFKIEHHNDFGFQFKLQIEKNKYRNISDFGSGISQLLPLLLATSTIKTAKAINADSGLKQKGLVNHSLLIVEEPESNLHPAMQSKLADMFSILHKERNLDFVIETHSEYMVRRFQNLIALGELRHQDIIINYFWNDKGRNKCKQIEFREDGGLTDTFEKGFFDESLMLELDLLKIKNLN